MTYQFVSFWWTLQTKVKNGNIYACALFSKLTDEWIWTDLMVNTWWIMNTV